MGVQVERGLEGVAQLAHRAALQEIEALVELRDVLKVLGPVQHGLSEMAAYERLDRAVGRGGFELQPEHGFGMAHIELIPHLSNDVDTDVLGGSQPFDLQLHHVAHVRTLRHMVAEKCSSRLQHLFIRGEGEHRGEQRFGVLHFGERCADLVGRP